ncbi:MAG: PAS domain S-box protein [Rhodocyclaceae bacterium]|nr:PAS domain S-box protein [Rhodocyclaceae bacterium]
MFSAPFLKRQSAWALPAIFLAGLCLSALVGWISATWTGRQAGFGVFGLLGAVTLVMTALLAWALHLAARETHRAESALAEAREAGEKFSELVELSSDWYWEQDEQFRFTAISGGVINKGGSLISTSLGKMRWELDLHEPEAAAWRRHRGQLERHEPFHDFRYALRVADGSVRTYSVSGRPRFADDGTFLGYRGVGHDISDATRAEAALRQSESQLRQIAENMPAMFVSFRNGRVCTYCNRRYAAFYDLTPDQVLGRHLRDYIGEETHALIDPYLQRVEAGEAVNYERAIRTHDGATKYIDAWLLPQRADDCTLTGFYAMVSDITARKEMELALRRSKAQLVKAQEVAQTGSWELDIPSNRLTMSEEAYRIFGIAPGTPLTYDLFMQRVHPDDRAAVDAAWAAAMAGAPYDIEHRIIDGVVRWVRERAEIEFDADGACLEGIGTVQDITERKEAELKLRLAASVFENSLEGVTITDAERSIISVNSAFTRITGYDSDEVIGRNPRLLKSGRQGTSFYAAMWLAIEQNGFWSGEVWNRRKNGEIYPEILSITAIRDERGRTLHYIGIFTDITDIKRAEEAVRAANAGLEQRVRERTAELEASNRELEAFSYSVAHDLRGPLRGIEGFAHVIAEDYADGFDDAGRNYLSRIQQAAKRMAQLIDDLLELARIMRADMERRDIDLSALAQSVAHDLQAGSERSVRFHIAPDLKARADPTLMASALGNLLENAWKFTAREPSARIEFGADHNGAEPVFYVRDNGAGFDPAYAGKLFQPFQRLHHPNEFAGTGIGLATTARIVRRHGGRIWAEGTPGQGATFRFTLP